MSSNEGSSTAARRDRRKERVKEGRIIRTDVNRKKGGGAPPLLYSSDAFVRHHKTKQTAAELKFELD